MKIKCKHCGEYFYPDDETVELIFSGYITSDTVNTCDECWEMLNSSFNDDLSDIFSDADSGL